MTETTIVVIVGSVTTLVGGVIGTAISWLKLSGERKHTDVDTQGQIIKDLTDSYVRVCDESSQWQMRVKACEAENELCRKQIQELQNSVNLLQVEMGRQYRLSMLARARAHLGQKMIGNYELHNEYVLDEIRDHNKRQHPKRAGYDENLELSITPMMRTHRLREGYQGELEKLEAMEARELETLLKDQLAEEGGETPSN